MKTSTWRCCPNCKTEAISAWTVFRSVSGVGSNPRCPSCQARLTVGASWQGNVIGFLLFALLFTAAASISQHSALPYLVLPVALGLAVWSVWTFASFKVVLPPPAWLRKAHYVVFAFAVGAFLYCYSQHYFG